LEEKALNVNPVKNINNPISQEDIEDIYNKVVQVLNVGAERTVPFKDANFFKFWWDEELDILKQESINSHNIWVSNGRPRNGPIFSDRNKCN